MFVIQHQPHRAGTDLGRELVACLLAHGSTFSRVGASGKPGAVQGPKRENAGIKGPSARQKAGEEIGRETLTHSSRMERSTELPADGKFRMLDRSSVSERPPNV